MTNAGTRNRFDVDALRELAGDKVFSRGQAYHRQGVVQILAFEQKHVLAQVAGAEDHRTALNLRMTLARASETSHPREAQETYAQRVEELNASGDRAYEEAAQLVAHMAALKARFGRRRNFMKLLT